MVRFLILLVSILMAMPAYSALAADDLMVEGWARATASKARNGAAYLMIRNNSGTADKLISSRSDAAKRASLHNHLMDGGVMKMRPVDAADVPANGMVMMKPGGLHIMLMGLKAPLKKGETLPLTVTFEKAGVKAIQVKILSMGAKGMDGKHKMHGKK